MICFFPFVMSAQEKTQYYYSTHETEIIPDARSAFQKGDYDRAIELCNWHYILVGSQDAAPLRSQAERCSRLSKEMTDLFDAGKLEEAKEAANTLLSINANDSSAKKLLAEIEKQLLPIPSDSLVVDMPTSQDSVLDVTSEPEEMPIEEPFQETVPITIVEEKDEPTPSITNTSSPIQKSFMPKTMFVVKAGASVLTLQQIAQSVAPGGSLGLYNLGGSRVGLEAGGYLSPNLMSSGSLFGIDASLVFRAAKSVYPKLGVGYFSYSDNSDSDSATHGLCAGGGLTFLIGSHFCLELSAKYYPEIRIQGVETVSTTPGASYEFPLIKQILPGGIAPFVSIGWAF